MIKNGKSKKEAAILGAAEVGGAITASTLTTLAVFIPIMFLKGLAGSIFKEMALTVCFSLGCSLIIALTVVPSFAAKFLTDKDDEVKETKLKKLDEKINSNKKLGYTVTGIVIALIAVSAALVSILAIKLSIFYGILIGLVVAAFMIVALVSSRGKVENKEGKITKTYEKTIRWSINHKTIVLLSSIVLLVVSTFLALSKGFALIPATDEGSISGSIIIDSTMPSSYVYSVADDCTKTIMESSDDIDIIQTRVGSTSLMATILGQSGGGSTINFTIALKDDRAHSTKKNRQIIEEKVKESLDMDYVEEVEFSEASSMTSMLGTSGTMIYVEGSNLYELEAVANDLVKVLETVEGVEKPDNGVTQGDDTVKITVNKDEAIKLGLYSKDYSNAVNLLYKGLGYDIDTAGKEVLKVTVDGVQYELSTSATASIDNYKLDKSLFLGSIAVYDNNLYQLLDTYEGHVYMMNPQLAALLSPMEYMQIFINMGLTEEQAKEVLEQTQAALLNGDAKIIIINPNIVYDSTNNVLREEDRYTYTLLAGESWVDEEVKTYIIDKDYNSTTVEYQTGFTTITRNGKNRYLCVTGQLADGYNATKVGSKVTSAVNEYLKSDDFKPYQNTVRVYEEGENEQIMDVVRQLIVCGIVAILLVYMIMCIQFQSLKYPLIIMGTIPLAFTGGFILLFICGMELSMVALIGLVVLVGVVVNNGIVIVDYMNQLVEEGMTVKEAAVLAGKTRLRPIFMTALTTIFALLTMALGIGESAEIMQPLAVAAIGGLTYATALTLLVVPSLYVMMSRKKIKKEEANNTDSNVVESEDNGEVSSN